MTYRVEDSNANPYVFSPSVDWNTFSEPNIIHAY